MLINNLLISFNAVIPMFLIIGVGYFVGKNGLISEEAIKQVNNIVFNIFAPCMLFSNLYGQNIKDVINGRFLLMIIVVYIFTFLLTYLFVYRYKKGEPKTSGAMIHAVCRSNVVFIGLPLAENLLGAGNIAFTTMMISCYSPLQTLFGVATLERFRGEKINIFKIIKSVFLNPFIIGSLLGFMSIIFNLKLPEFIINPISVLGSTVSPLALFLLGASLDFNRVKEKVKDSIICVILRLIIVPSIALIVCAMMGFRGEQIVSTLVLFASPCAVITFTMAQNMDSDYDLAGATVVLSSIVSCFTLFIFIYILKTLGLF